MRTLLLAISLAGAATAAPLAAQQGPVEFQRQILPIFEQRCFECHATAAVGARGTQKKPKGGVVLDSKAGITSSLKGKLVVAKNPEGSALYASISLPADHDDRMPPAKKGDALSAEQQGLVKKWIEDGASFGTWVGKKPEAVAATPKPDETGKPAKPGDKPKVDPLLRLQEGVKALPAATLAAFDNGPFLVVSMGDQSPLLSVSCRGNTDALDDRALAALDPIASHICELDLARTRVGDEACKKFATMSKLVSLDLRQTAVGNSGIALLNGCKELRSLNLFGTKAGDYGITALSACKHLEHLYVWQTEVTAAAAVRLRDSVPGLRVVMTADLPEPMSEGQGGNRRRR